MIWVDALIVASLVALTYTGYTAGLLREAIVLLAAVLGVVLAGVAYDNLTDDIDVFVDDLENSQRVAFLALIGAVVLVGIIISFLIKTNLEVFDLGSSDSLGGAFAGFLKGLILVEAVLFAFITFPALGLPEATKDSIIGSFLVEELPFVKALLPGLFDTRVDAL
ncbi:MAG: CvpA family protein [Dehalococcoidia bacterium]